MEFSETCGYGGSTGAVVACDVHHGFFFAPHPRIAAIVGAIVGAGAEAAAAAMATTTMAMTCSASSLNAHSSCSSSSQVTIFEALVVEMVVYGYLCVCARATGEGRVSNW